jgi:hypothetical protein
MTDKVVEVDYSLLEGFLQSVSKFLARANPGDRWDLTEKINKDANVCVSGCAKAGYDSVTKMVLMFDRGLPRELGGDMRGRAGQRSSLAVGGL